MTFDQSSGSITLMSVGLRHDNISCWCHALMGSDLAIAEGWQCSHIVQRQSFFLYSDYIPIFRLIPKAYSDWKNLGHLHLPKPTVGGNYTGN